MRFHTRQRRKPTINIISLIDILCILLIFFIVTTVFKKEEPVIKIDLPESTQAKPTNENIPTLITVTEDSKIYLGDKLVSPEALGKALKEALSAKPDLKLAMKASKKAPFETIIKVMDATRSAGIKQLPTFTEEATAPTP